MNNRQAGRRRGRGGQRQGGNPGRPDNGNRIDNRARGNAAQLLEKYKNLAADAQRSGDRVNTEYYLQFADHYFRVLAENRSRAEENGQARRPREDDGFEEEGDEFGFEGEIGSPAHYQQVASAPVDRDERPRRSRDEGEDRGSRPEREERPRRAREDGEDRASRAEGDARPRRQRDDSEDRPARAEREARPRRERDAVNDTGEERSRREPRTVAPEVSEVDGDVRETRPEPANDEPRRRGRPRREAAAPASSEGGLDVAALPPAISGEAPAADEAPAERPRRGRPRRVRTDEGEAVPPAA